MQNEKNNPYHSTYYLSVGTFFVCRIITNLDITIAVSEYMKIIYGVIVMLVVFYGKEWYDWVKKYKAAPADNEDLDAKFRMLMLSMAFCIATVARLFLPLNAPYPDITFIR